MAEHADPRAIIRQALAGEKVAPEYFEWIEAEVGRAATDLALERFAKEQKRLLTSDENRAAAFCSGYVAAMVTAAMFARGVAPLLRQLRRYTILLSASFVAILSAASYLWFLGDAASFKAFSIMFFPGAVGVGLTVAKAWKSWAEGKKALAEARKIEAEIR